MKAFHLILCILLLTACTDSNNKIEHSVTINAPLKIVWDYNADNSNAKNWSIFFAKISNCPIKDCPGNIGLSPIDVGFIRRCYRNNDEKGLYWDEVTLKTDIKNEFSYRQILAYNFNGYPFKMFKEKMEFNVEQFYTRLNDQTTQLKFSTNLKPYKQIRVNNDGDENNDSTWVEESIISTFAQLGKKRALEIFKENLENIKLAIELKEEYKRKNQYTKYCNTENFFCTQGISDL